MAINVRPKKQIKGKEMVTTTASLKGKVVEIKVVDVRAKPKTLTSNHQEG